LFQIVASDTTVFQDYTREYYNIEDKEIIKISLRDKISKTKLKPVKEERVQIRLPPGVPHYYVMEMLDQPNAVCKALNYGARLDGQMVKLGGLEQNEEALVGIENLYIAACGTSYYAGQYAEYLMRELEVFSFV
jgi:glucosamine--fructose-6-phosphate aminotransferase (isomerizing)